MKKSNKGFTLIELLAVIVLLGVLFMYAIPEVVGLVSRNRDKMYVADIKKLMSQAEYTVRASNTKIEKPDPDSFCAAGNLRGDPARRMGSPRGSGRGRTGYGRGLIPGRSQEKGSELWAAEPREARERQHGPKRCRNKHGPEPEQTAPAGNGPPIGGSGRAPLCSPRCGGFPRAGAE